MKSKAAARPKPRPAPARSDRDGHTEQRILDAAHTVFIRHGTAGARMQDIAAEAGVNQALLHYYFRTKEQLSAAVFRQAASQLMPSVLAVVTAPDVTLEDKVERIVEIELTQLSRTPYLPGYVICEMHHHPERIGQMISAVTGVTPDVIRPALLATLQRQIDERHAAGTMRAMPADQFLVNLLALCIFPFAARPMISAMFGFDDTAFDRFIARRRAELAGFYLSALRP